MSGINNGIPLVNGQLCAWAEIVVAIGGVPLTGITSIEYADKQEVKNEYGAGRHPIGRGKGRITPSGKMTLYREEVVALMRRAPRGRLQDLPAVDVTVSYIPMGSVDVITDKIRNCAFSEVELKAKEGDTSLTVDLPLVPSHIEWGAGV